MQFDFWPQFGRALLVVHEHGHPRDTGELLLNLGQPVTVEHPHPPRQPDAAILLRLVGGHHHARHPFGEEFAHQGRHCQPPDRRLATGHGDRVVVQQLVGDVRARRYRRPDREDARVMEGAIAEVLEQVRDADERGHADPGSTLAAHLAEPEDIADPLCRHHQRDGVAADARTDERAVRDRRRSIVRASRTEVGGARQDRQHRPGVGTAGGGTAGVCSAGGGQARGRPAGTNARVPLEPGRQLLREVFGRQVRLSAHERCTRGPALSRNPRPVRQVKQDVLDTELNERLLLLHHNDLRQPGRELGDGRRVEREDHSEFQDPDPGTRQRVTLDTESLQRLHRVAITRPRGDDPDRGIRITCRLREAIGHPVAPSQLQARPNHARLKLPERRLKEVGGHLVVERETVDFTTRRDGYDAASCHRRRRRAIDDVRRQLHPDPQAAETRHRDAVQTEVKDFPRVGGNQQGHAEFGDSNSGTTRHGRRLGDGVVADQHQGASSLRCAAQIGVAERIGRPVEPRCLAVPNAHDTVVLAGFHRRDELRTLHGIRGQLFVHRRPKNYPVFLEQGALPAQLEVETR